MMLALLVAFTDDAAALEKCLRFLQYACQTVIGLTAASATSRSLLQAQSQFNLGMAWQYSV